MDELPEEARKRIMQDRVNAAYERGRLAVLNELRGEFEAYDHKVFKYIVMGIAGCIGFAILYFLLGFVFPDALDELRRWPIVQGIVPAFGALFVCLFFYGFVIESRPRL